jgi:phytoene dehydrogenase-like protein
MEGRYDAVIIGSGPNGLSAGIFLAQKGLKVLILEGADEIGGGTRTAELTLPGFYHDVCSAVHPMGILSPWFQELNLEKYGLEWVFPEVSVAHPLDGQEAVLLSKSVEETASYLGKDEKAYRRIFQPLAEKIDWLLEDSLKPLGIPRHPFFLAKFGIKALLPAHTFAKLAFKEDRSKALFAGCAAHSILPFDKLFTTALGLVFLSCGHAVDWPVAKGGSQSITMALANCFEDLGGEIRLNHRVKHFDDLPPSKTYLFDTDPFQLADIAGEELPHTYRNRLKKYRFGPGVFKIDYALKEPIPWKDPNCLKASTVHIGGRMEEIALGEKEAWKGKHSDRPYVLLAQQSQFDPSRSPEGKHTCWAYCHVPHGSTKDMSQIIENQIERFAPGFSDAILAKSSMNSQAFHRYNPNYVGGAVTGGSADLSQLFTRPVARLDPYSTPNPRIFLCSASTPPGGGVHGMCGFHAAKSVWKRLKEG